MAQKTKKEIIPSTLIQIVMSDFGGGTKAICKFRGVELFGHGETELDALISLVKLFQSNKLLK